MMAKPAWTECRSEDGITVGLIDALISIARVLAPRLRENYVTEDRPIYEAIADLMQDPDIKKILVYQDLILADANRIWPTKQVEGA